MQPTSIHRFFAGPTRMLTLALAGVGLLSLSAQAQSIQQAVPPVGSPGDEIRLLGSGLSGVSSVTFSAVVGGFVGIFNIPVAPVVISDQELRVVVPKVNAFSPPNATPPGEVNGLIQLPMGLSSIAFGYLEATQGQVQTFGKGSSNPAGIERRIGFDLAKGPPAPGNAGFVGTGFNLPPGGVGFLVAGRPATLPYLPFEGGELLLDLGLPLVFIPTTTPTFTLTGEASAAQPLPASLVGQKIAFQWLGFDTVSFQASVTNGLLCAF